MKLKLGIGLKSIWKAIDISLLKEINWFKELPYLVLLIVMAFFYISNQYEAERLALEKNRLTKEIHELREKSISFASEVMFISKPSEVNRMVQKRGMGLKEANKPPVKIVIEKRDK